MSASATTGVIASAVAPAGGAWSPADLASLRGWWNFDEANVTKDGSDNISAVDDLGGDFGQFGNATGATQPLWVEAGRNGLDIAHFGSQRFLDASSGPYASFTLAMAFRYDENASQNRVLLYSFQYGQLLYNTTTNELSWGNQFGSKVAASYTSGTWVVVAATFNSSGNVIELRINGVSQGTLNPVSYVGPLTALTLGKQGTAYHGDLYVGELIATDSVLSGDDLTNLETYLSDKWL